MKTVAGIVYDVVIRPVLKLLTRCCSCCWCFLDGSGLTGVGTSGKRPGTSGACGEAHKHAAVIVAIVFLEACCQLEDPVYDFGSVPAHIDETQCVPIAKGADTVDAIRDLEIPNEDTKAAGDTARPVR